MSRIYKAKLVCFTQYYVAKSLATETISNRFYGFGLFMYGFSIFSVLNMALPVFLWLCKVEIPQLEKKDTDYGFTLISTYGFSQLHGFCMVLACHI